MIILNIIPEIILITHLLYQNLLRLVVKVFLLLAEQWLAVIDLIILVNLWNEIIAIDWMRLIFD